MKKKILIFCFLVSIFSVTMALPLMAYPVTADWCYYCGNLEEELPENHCSANCSCVYHECPDCGREYLWDPCSSEHSYGGYESVNSANCTDCEEEASVCSDCGEYYDYVCVSPPLGHQGTWVIVTEATCDTEGLRQMNYCKRCYRVISEAIPALGHDTDGRIMTSEYLKSAATCTSAAVYYKSCSRCGEKSSSTFTSGSKDASNHTMGIVNGGTSAVHTKYKCCGTVVSSKHSYSTSVSAQATCTSKGKTKYTCSCGYYYTSSNIPALGHSYVSTVTSPTCLETGHTTHVCSRCSDTYTDSETPALGHSYTDTVTAPTCIKAGYTTHTCSRCSDTYTDSEIPATGHTWTDTTREEPTCTEPGLQHQACACGETKSIEILAPGHSYTGTVTPPTCTEAGYTTHTCSACGDFYTDSETPATGHTWTDTTREEPTCTEPGLQHQACACGETQSIDIDALGHDISVEEIIQPTCTKQGYTIRKCSRCDVSEIVPDSFVGLIDHQYRNGVCGLCGAFSPNSGSSGSAIGDDEEPDSLKKMLSAVLLTVTSAATAAIFDSAKKKR